MSRFYVIALLLHLPLFAYPVLRLCGWFDFSALITACIFIPVFFSQIFARKILRDRIGKVPFVLRNVADFILGMSPVVLGFLLIAEVIVLSFNIDNLHAAFGVIFFSLITIFKGVYDAFHPQVKNIVIKTKKLDKSVRFVQITDVHIGSRSSRFLKKVIDQVNDLQPEFLCITGDFIDQPGITKKQLSSLKEFDGPIYQVIGNHEIYEDLEDIIDRLNSLGVNLLRTKTMDHDGVQLIGIDDSEDLLQVSKELDKISVNESKFSILLYHRPVGLEACSKKGIDLMISGHTHGGQIFPFNLLVNRTFERVLGLFELNGSKLYVSSGTGTWGPVLRVGTKSEITLFEVEAV